MSSKMALTARLRGVVWRKSRDYYRRKIMLDSIRTLQ